ncbi:hypothetical protein MLD38_036616 [Melastoma candidum]|uniref:Uncharacterized protein n=1 Tax=Melastoma candidum TaxID=119954 RepID=A0ACB9LLG1_9MYRT|nr:hypothetical protein MLD38_036616 [Melastoma candidum]
MDSAGWDCQEITINDLGKGNVSPLMMGVNVFKEYHFSRQLGMDSNFALATLCLMLVLSCIGGRGGGRVYCLSLEEDRELEEEYARLKKPAVKTIKMDYGDVYDCVDFYDQPAFDHPLLKDHKHEYHQTMKPSSYPKREIFPQEDEKSGWRQTSMRRVDCPIGTVPIRRTTKEEFITAKMQAKARARINGSNTEGRHGLHVAIMRTKAVTGKRYNGGGGWMTVEDVPKTNDKQYSSAQMKIQRNADTIQVGWMVNPSLYEDKRPRGFIFQQTTMGACLNLMCPGFILARSDMPVDGLMESVSHYGGPLYYIKYYIYRDKAKGAWYLEVGPKNVIIGFWPQALFTGLSDRADYLDWGGEVFSPPSIPGPPMGRGRFPIGNIQWDASFKDIVTINETGDTVVASYTDAYSDVIKRYWLIDHGVVKAPYFHTFTYGGPGGATGW